MKQYVLVFLPGEVSKIGLWRPHDNAADWCTREVPRGTSSPSNEPVNRVLTELDTLLAEIHVPLETITHIGVMHGPSSYTELRLFVSTANTLAWARSLPIFHFGPESAIPEALPSLIPTARVNMPVQPVYPPLPGA
jgi:hypothetical protein